MIIEVALGIEEAVGRREDGGRELLGRRLTIRPSDRDDRDAQLLTVVAGEQLQGLRLSSTRIVRSSICVVGSSMIA